ncbi:SURF1 family protein, partial [Sphingomonas bacterium]|uniref:SURF1 family protein n=1 Tax=Sphingomonas bacterium TaxID=1895847 RepID=UPI001C2D5CB2
MSRRLPLVPTLIVALAALLMVRLGVWQLHRLHEKEALIARFAANLHQPPAPFAALAPIGEDRLYRRATATCATVRSWRGEAGRGADGT